MKGAAVLLESFSTAGVHDSKRVALWEDYNARALVGLECRLLTGRRLEASETNLDAGALRFAHVTASPHVVERSRRHISSSPLDGVALYFTLHGESFFYSEDGVIVQRPGGLLACDVNEPFMRGFAQGLEEYALQIPHDVYQELAGGVPLTKPVASSFTEHAPEAARGLARLLRTTFAGSGLDDPGAIADAERRALGLLRQLLRPDRMRGSAAVRRTALTVIDDHLRDPRLCVGSVAKASGVSERHLARAFAETGTTVARTILQRRLDLAHRVLVGDQPGPGTIGDVATWCGFGSHSHFSRVFHDRFEATPESVRDQRDRENSSV